MDIQCNMQPEHPPGSPEAERLKQEHEREREVRLAQNKPVLPWKPPKPLKPKMSFREIVGHINLVIIAISITFFAAYQIAGPKKGPPGPSTYGAFLASHDFVRDELKSPGSAKWENFTESAVTKTSKDIYVVKSWVDSQNGFGGLVRTKYTCIARHIGGDRWRLVSLTFR